jgi:hypothetical protein
MSLSYLDIFKKSYLDIFKKTFRGNPVWIDAVGDLESARVLLARWTSAIPGEYFAFDQRSHQIVASVVRLESDGAQSFKRLTRNYRRTVTPSSLGSLGSLILRNYNSSRHAVTAVASGVLLA